jgi:hypothetical protein
MGTRQWTSLDHMRPRSAARDRVSAIRRLEPEHRSNPELDSASVLLKAMIGLSTLPNAGSASAFILIYLEAGVLRYSAGSTLGLFDCRRSQSPLTRHSAQ